MPSGPKETPRDLTGRWLGRYDYDSGEGVPFEADLIEAPGMITGIMHEPNTFDPEASDVLIADLDGTHAHDTLQFEKLYRGSSAQDCPTYEGRVNAGLTRIEGTWFFRLYPGHHGRFVMMRKPIASMGASREVAAEVE